MIRNRLAVAIALAIFIIAAALGLRYAADAGWIGDEAAKRIMQVIIGLNLAGYANLMPKQLAPMRRSPLIEARMQSAVRVGGRAMTLAGLIYAGLWAFAPIWFADPASLVAVAAAMALMLAYASRAFSACRSAGVPTGA